MSVLFSLEQRPRRRRLYSAADGSEDGTRREAAPACARRLSRQKRGDCDRTPAIYASSGGSSLFSASLFGQYKFRNWGLYAGAQYSWSGVDYLEREAISSSPTQGRILTGIAGATIQFNSWVIQGNYHIPIAQNLGEGNSHQKTRKINKLSWR